MTKHEIRAKLRNPKLDWDERVQLLNKLKDKSNTLRKDYRDIQFGPGGLHCPCCNPWDCHPRKTKPLMRRRLRRKLKEKIHVQSIG